MTTIQCGQRLTRQFEGCTLTAKPDAKSAWSIGRGHDIPAPEDPKNPPTWTQQQADDQFEIDYRAATSHACQVVGPGVWTTLNAPRQAALADMAFELGAHGLGEFHGMLTAVRARDWATAKRECLDSDYAKQVPNRAAVVADILVGGTWPPATT